MDALISLLVYICCILGLVGLGTSFVGKLIGQKVNPAWPFQFTWKKIVKPIWFWFWGTIFPKKKKKKKQRRRYYVEDDDDDD